MKLVRVRVVGVGAFDDVVVSLADDEGNARSVAVIFGGDGTGKTTLLGAIAQTRPGHTLPPLPRARPRLEEPAREGPSFVLAEWALGEDDPERPHPLLVASPSAVLEGETETAAVMRRREQALFEKRAQEGGFAFVAISGARWFSRTSVLLSQPERSVARYDLRAAASFDDATRADMTRDTKQILSYAAIAHALERARSDVDLEATSSLDLALREVASVLLAPFAVRYDGADPSTLEPVFVSDSGRALLFDDLPKGARHLLAIGAHATRALHGAYAGATDSIREREGVVLVDDLESQQEAALLRDLPDMLARALPRVQWIVTTASAAVTLGAPRDAVLALRRASAGKVEIHEGPLATLH